MANNKLILRTLTSPWTYPTTDITKNSVLTHADVDNNFIYIKGEVIQSGFTSGTDLILNKVNGGTISLDFGSLIASGNTYTTGSTLIGSTVYFDRTDALSAFTTDLSSLEVNDTFISGMTFNNGTYDLTINRNDGTNFTESLSILSGDMVVTGGTYDIGSGVVTFTNNSGGTFGVTGFTSGMTDSYTTTATTSGNTLIFDNNIQGSNLFSVDLSSMTLGAFTHTASGQIAPTNAYGNSVSDNYSSILGGGGNSISAGFYYYNNIVGGADNTISGYGGRNSIGGGDKNLIGGGYFAFVNYSVVGGGSGNTIGSYYAYFNGAFIGGGKGNNIYGGYSNYASIGGGYKNTINYGANASIGGGYKNTINYGYNSTIGGGQNNYIRGVDSFIGSGSNIRITGNTAIIVGGYDNTVNGNFSLIGGGGYNSIIGVGSNIAGGGGNTIIGYNSTIGGGDGHTIKGNDSVIGGGESNYINDGGTSVINGGLRNTITGATNFGSTILGGWDNEILDSNRSLIAGGSQNTISGGTNHFIIAGSNNFINASNSATIIGGSSSTVNNHNNVVLLGGGLTSVSGNTTHVDKLNIKFLNPTTAVTSLALDANGMVVDGSSILSGFTSGATDNFTTGSTLIGSTIYFDRTDALSAFTTDLSSLEVNDTFTTGFTVNENTYTITDNFGSAFTATWTGNTSGSCVNDFYVSNIHSCSPLHINPLDEGDLYFGASSGVSFTIATGGTMVGINVPTPNYGLHMAGDLFVANGAVGIGESPNPATPTAGAQKVRITTTDTDGHSLSTQTSITNLRIDASYEASKGTFQGVQIRSISNKSGAFSTLFGVNTILGGPTSNVTSGNHTFIAGRFKSDFQESGGNADNYALQLEDGSEGTIGHVWTSVSVDGKGHWGAIGGGAISGDTFVSGATLIGSTIYFDRNDSLSAFTTDLSSLNTGGTVTSLSALTDTTINTPLDGEHLIYSGGSWVNAVQQDIYFTATTNGQTVFNSALPTTPITLQKTMFFVNGVKQRYGATHDYIITGGTDVVWVTNKHTIGIADGLEMIYI